MDQYSAYLGRQGHLLPRLGDLGRRGQHLPAGARAVLQAALRLARSEGARRRRSTRTSSARSSKGIAFHEIGHSIGMRHNFASSWDSLNYAPQYWQLRTNEGKATEPCAAPAQRRRRHLHGSALPRPDDGRRAGPRRRVAPRHRVLREHLDDGVPDRALRRDGRRRHLRPPRDEDALRARRSRRSTSARSSPRTSSTSRVKTLSQGISDGPRLRPDQGLRHALHEGRAQAKVFDADARLPPRDGRGEGERQVAHRPRQGLRALAEEPPRLRGHEVERDQVRRSAARATSIGVNGVRWSGLDENGTARSCAGSTATARTTAAAATSTRSCSTAAPTSTRSRRTSIEALRPHATRGRTSAGRTRSSPGGRCASAVGEQHLRSAARLSLEHDDRHRPRDGGGSQRRRPGLARRSWPRRRCSTSSSASSSCPSPASTPRVRRASAALRRAPVRSPSSTS